MLERIRNILHITWGRCYNVQYQERLASYLQKIFTTYQERVASHLKKMLQSIRNIWQVTWRRVYNVSGNVSGTPGKLLECNVTAYQERLESHLQNMLQRIRIHHAGPLNPTHVPAPCPQVLP